MNPTEKILTCAQMREVEKAAAEGGLDYRRLMENAGSAAAKTIRQRYPVAGRSPSCAGKATTAETAS